MTQTQDAESLGDLDKLLPEAFRTWRLYARRAVAVAAGVSEHHQGALLTRMLQVGQGVRCLWDTCGLWYS